MAGFVHLHVHSEYSLRESTLRIRDMVRYAAETGAGAIAITDTNAMYGAVSFYVQARAAGVKPILGVQLTVAMDPEVETVGEGRPGAPGADTCILLAEDFAGYQGLVRLVSLAWQRYRNPVVSFAELGAHINGVIVLVGGGESVLSRLLSAGDEREAERWWSAWRKVVPSTHLFLDVQDHGLPGERKALPRLLAWSKRDGVPAVATNDAHYLAAGDAPLQRILAGMDGGEGTGRQGDRYDLAEAPEMERRLGQIDGVLERTFEIAARCNVELPLDARHLPVYPIESGENASEVLRRAAVVGVRQRYGSAPSETVRKRLEYELSVIERMGYADYFLVVADFIRYAHRQGISTGPGRGSAAGSLVAYALRITDVDPIAGRLLFERFLNPERVSLPDIDTDFEFERRAEVIHYVAERYGGRKVAQIGTFGTLAAKAAVRDVGRALSVDPKLVDSLAKRIPSSPGMTLQRAMAEVGEIDRLLKEQPDLAKLWQAAVRLEGLPRHTSTHAAGVVIAPMPVTDLVPVQPGSDGIAVTQYAMEDIERLGLVKMDFLGLRTLTLIDRAVESIAARSGQRLDWSKIATDDKAAFTMLAKGETEGCFQLESSGIKRVLRDMKPTNMDDLIAVISLYRPGPMENIPAFIAAKHGRTQVNYPHPDLKPILQDTYGVIVYQEQIMQIASRMAGFSLGQADLLRRAVSKKKREVLDRERAAFVAGCIEKGYEESTANDVYDLIVRFADYGYPLSHAAAYAVLSYRTAYLRANHLPDFLTALLSMSIGNPVKEQEYMRDAKRHGIAVLPPSVSVGGKLYQVAEDGSIRSGLLSVRNVGRGAVDAILEARSQASFTSLVDFLTRVNPRQVNRKAVESLLQAGALDDFMPQRAAPEAKVQILEEAYRELEGSKVGIGVGLGLDFGGGRDDALYIRYQAKRLGTAGLDEIKETLAAHRGQTPVVLVNAASGKGRLLDTAWSVTVGPELVAVLEELVGLGNVKVGALKSRRG